MLKQAEITTWDHVLTQVTNKYLNLSQGKNSQWVAACNKKGDLMIKAMQAQIKMLQEKIKLLEGPLSKK